MRSSRKNRLFAGRRSMFRSKVLRMERLEERLALTVAPLAFNDFYDGGINEELSIAAPGILANDTSGSGAAMSAGLFSGPSHGTLEFEEDGSFRYVPEADYEGLDSFLYFANDGGGDSMLAAVTIDVQALNHEPVAANDSFALAEDATFAVDAAAGILANDADADGDPLAITVTSQPLHGSLTVNPDGSLSYTPEANYNGFDGFSYLVNDGAADSDVASATFVIGAVNDLPVGVNDEYTTAEDTPLELAAAGVLVNDTDIDGDVLSSILVNPPQQGTVTLGADGGLVYTPGADFHGVDGFSYLASDGAGNSEATAVTINVTAVADAPAAMADAYATDEDLPLVVDVAAGVLLNDSDGDGDPLLATMISGPANGTLVLNADGSFSYTPNENFHGADSFTYMAGDGTLSSTETLVSLTVNAVNDAPAASGDAYSLDEDTPLAVDALMGVLMNDSDIDGDALTAEIVTGPANGSLTLNADGSFDYVPVANFSGTDSFVYAAKDGSLTSHATVALTVNPIAEAPVPAIDNYSTGEDVPLVVGVDLGVLANDVSPEGGAMTAEVVTGPEHGTLTMNADGSFSFTPTANYHGTDSFTYKASTEGQEVVALANIVIEPLNDAPVAAADEFTLDPADGQTAIVQSVLANDSDIDGDALAANLVSGPANGTLTLNADGTFSYTPEEGFSGDDSFRYQLFDGKANSNVATVTLHVLEAPEETPPPEEVPPPAENQRPIAVNDVFTMEGDTTLAMPDASGLLVNDSDPEGSPLTAGLFSDPLHGNVSVAADGSFSYIPDSGYEGLDAFLYRVSDGELFSALAAVTIYVTPSSGPDEAPIPVPTPEPCPEPEPAPQPCRPRPICQDDSGDALESRGRGHRGRDFVDAVDAIFSHRGWWRSRLS